MTDMHPFFERDGTRRWAGRGSAPGPGTRRLAVLVIALLCALAGSSLAASTAGAEDNGKITGTVTDSRGGDQLEGIGVCARLIPGGASSCTRTGERIGSEPGEYEIGALAAGSYEVEFFETTIANTYLVQFWDDKESEGEAEPVTVTEGATTSGIDAAMHEGGKIAGVVTAALGGDPIAGILACAVEAGGFGSPIKCVETDAAGKYMIGGLYDGSYKVEFHPGLHCGCDAENYRTQFYDGGESLEEAESLTVSVGATTGGIDARMASANKHALTVSLAGAGSGTVTGSPAGIDCGTACTAEYGEGETVTLTASAASGSTFAGWSGGGCEGAGACRVTVEGDNVGVTATFDAGGGGTPGGGGTTETPPSSPPSEPPNTPPAPGTKLLPAKIDSAGRRATFRFKATGTATVTHFQCKLQRPHGKPKFRHCSSPISYRHLLPGRYLFSVRALGPGGADPTPAKRHFRVRR